MSGDSKGLGSRIELAPFTSREELIDAVFGPDQDKDDPSTSKIAAETVPRAEEWIDLADAGPYVDESTVPLYSPNGDGLGGKESYGGSEQATKWINDRFGDLPRIGLDEARPPASGDTE